MSVRTEVKVVISCDKCNSENTEITDWEMWDKKQHKEKTFSLDWEYWVTDSYKKKYHYTCKNCDYHGVEYDDKIY